MNVDMNELVLSCQPRALNLQFRPKNFCQKCLSTLKYLTLTCPLKLACNHFQTPKLQTFDDILVDEK